MIRKFVFLLFAVMTSYAVNVYSSAEEEPPLLDISIDYSNDPFYSELWFWIMIAAVLLFLLILLIRGGRKKSKPKPEVSQSTDKESQDTAN